MTNNVDKVSFAAIAISIGLSLLVCNWLYVFLYFRHKSCIVNRHPKSSILIAALSILILVIERPAGYVLRNLSNSAEIQEKYSLKYINTLDYVMIMYGTTFCFSAFLFRAWIFYFHIKWHKAMQDREWRLFIDPLETNWYLRHKTTFGSVKVTAFVLIVSHFCLTAFGTYSVIKNDHQFSNAAKLIIFPTVFLPTVFCAILYCKFPKFDDIWYIHDEIKFSIKMLMLVVLVYFILIVVLRSDTNTWQYTFASFLPCIIAVCFPFALMPWVLQKFNLPTNVYSLYKYQKLQKTEGILSRSLSLNLNDKQLIASHEGLRDTLQRKHGFNLLARHLSKEFAIENFLFFVETQQWLQSLYNRPSFSHLQSVDEEKISPYGSVETDPVQSISSAGVSSEQPQDLNRVISFSGISDAMKMSPLPKRKGYDLLTIKFHESIPKSNILRHYKSDLMSSLANSSDDRSGGGDRDEDDFDAIYEESVNIFQKYIPTAAYFSVNISYSSRQSLFAKFGFDESLRRNASGAISEQSAMICTVKENCNSEETIVQLFEEARQQVYKYLIYSYTRFKKTAEFKQLMAYHAKNEEKDDGLVSEDSHSNN